MTLLTKSKTLLPTWTGSLFDNGRLLSPRMLDLNAEFLPWDYVDRITSVNINENEKEFSIEMAAPRLDTDKINATYDKGILHVSIPKKEVTVSKTTSEIRVF